MDVFQQLIQSLNREEQRIYKLLCARSHSTEQRKDMALYEYARKTGEEYDESYILKKLYGPQANDKNSLYRLKNKVKADLQRSLNYINYNEGPRAITYNHLLLYEHFLARGLYPLAYHYLKRAEESAEVSEDFRSLEIVYSSAILLSQFYIEFDPLEYIQKRKQNEKKLAIQNAMDEVYTRLNFHLKTSFNYSREKIKTAGFLKQQLGGYHKIKELKNNYPFRVKIFKTLAQALVQQHNYSELVKYTRENLAAFENKGWLQGDNRETRLQMLVYICNGLYKLGHYFESLRYTAELKREMDAGKEEWKARYGFFYNSLLIYNYTQTKPLEAIPICDALLKSFKVNPNPQLEYVTLINKAIAQGQGHRFDDAIGTLNRVFINDYFRKSDSAFKMKIFMAEIMLYYMAGDYKYCEQRIKRFLKLYSPLLAGKEYIAEASMAGLLPLMIKARKGKLQNLKALSQKAYAFVAGKSNPADEDTQIFKYKDWIKQYAAQFKV